MNPSRLSFTLSTTGGYVDTAGFLALQGLFTAHVTGNFVTIGAALVLGTSGDIAKIAALPIFCLIIGLVRLAAPTLKNKSANPVASLLIVEIILSAIGGLAAIILSPFPTGDSWQLIVTGVFLVSSMAIQNGVHRIYLSEIPPTTLMTGSTTQIVIDCVDILKGHHDPQRTLRLKPLSLSVSGFAFGCAAAALLFYFIGMWCFVAPPLLGLLSVKFASSRHKQATLDLPG
jgi:uncharacterized membrane protein YoaK (UPF0700 family)